jgi:predicted nucleic acid-binding Zn ribbon protein
MELTGDEKILLIAGLGYLAVATIWILTLNARGRLMLRAVRELVEPELWEAIGSPDTLQAAMKDPHRRWHRFLRQGEYRRVCSDEVIALIDDYRQRTRRMLWVLVVAGLLLLIRFWPELKPTFL